MPSHHDSPSTATAAGGKRGGDTSFRRTWDVEKYTKLGEERDAQQRREAQDRREAHLRGERYRPRHDIKPETSDHAAVPDDQKTSTSPSVDTGAPRARQDFKSVVGKQYLVPSGASVGRRGKGAGFYCSRCDETYKDNAGWLDHLNSPAHLRRTGQSNNVAEARTVTLDQCLARLDFLKARHFAQLEKAKQVVERPYDLDRSIEEKRREEDLKIQQQRAERKKRRDENKVKKEPIDEDTDLQGGEDVMAAMGFRGFT